MKVGEIICLGSEVYFIERFLGKGKSAYSFLIKNSCALPFVLKQMHHEPCSYYHFEGNKLDMEIDAYKKLQKLKIHIPELLEQIPSQECLIKAFIDGENAMSCIANNRITLSVWKQLTDFAHSAKEAGFNPDFFPANFIVHNDMLYYIDYELNPYDEKWDFDHWGRYYWQNKNRMKAFLEDGDSKHINENIEKGLPFKKDVVSLT